MNLLLLGQNGLFSLASSLVKLLLGVFPLILLTPLDSLELLGLDLASLLDNLGSVSVSLDPPDLGHVSIAVG